MVDGIYNAIHEFLIKRNFHNTVEAFQEEIVHQSNKPPKDNYDINLVDVFIFSFKNLQRLLTKASVSSFFRFGKSMCRWGWECLMRLQSNWSFFSIFTLRFFQCIQFWKIAYQIYHRLLFDVNWIYSKIIRIHKAMS